MKGFWGLLSNRSKGMRTGDNIRPRWHYFEKLEKPKERWQYVRSWDYGAYHSICRAMHQEGGILQKQSEKPLRKECCAGCHAIFNKRYRLT